MKIISILILLLVSLWSNAQTIEATYRSTWEGKYSDPMYNLETSYTYSSNRSLQELSAGGGTKYKDTLLVNPEGELYAYKAPIVLPSNIVVFKDFETDSIYMQHSMRDETRAIKDAMEIYDWELQEETKEILGYRCKKATTTLERIGLQLEIVAWYAPEIEVSDGPRDYRGLPGLILEIESNSSTVLKVIEIKVMPDSELEIQPPVEEFFPLTYSRYNMVYKRGN